MNTNRRIVWCGLLLSAALLGRSFEASSNGITGYSGDPATGGANCNTCHSGGQLPTVTLEGPLLVAPGEENTYLLRIRQTNIPNNAAGGLGVSASAGSLAIVDPGTSLNGPELTHVAPRAMIGGEVSWSFNWTAPATPGVATLYGAGNAVNLGNAQLRDLCSVATLQVTVAQTSTPGEASGPSLDPLLVTDVDPATGVMTLAFEAGCGSTDNDIYYGPLDQVSSYGWTGEVCGVGTSGPLPGFDPGAGSYFFGVVGNDGADEGSYGVGGDAVPAERPPFAGNACGRTQNLASACD